MNILPISDNTKTLEHNTVSPIILHFYKFKLQDYRATWVAQSVKCLTLDFGSGHDLTVCGIEPHVRLHTQHEPCLRFSLSSLSAPPPAHALSLKKINIKKKKLWDYFFIVLYIQHSCGFTHLLRTFLPLDPFLHFMPSIWNHFLSAWNTSFGISFTEGLLRTILLCLPENVLIYPHCWKIFLLGIEFFISYQILSAYQSHDSSVV